MTLLTTWRHVRRLAAYSPCSSLPHHALGGDERSGADPRLGRQEIFDDLTENATLLRRANGWIALLAGLALGEPRSG